MYIGKQAIYCKKQIEHVDKTYKNVSEKKD